ncbi:penicillin-binding protein 2 [Nocardioides nematodiphilus]|uniref:penicillin-binding protein 2 n=1 Tax=Nocardioides nematodiphilus TaxID=2849669 RepID=UPI001CD9D89C|nr:penicillin-binding protein 2 [Nocardioides nematodiphilus]MCA1984134.1 penicillin-binding protein 2 [Nocardioides nematodiphilus]
MTTATRTNRTSKLRLIVLQALVFSLFATLGVRLWYLQVTHGSTYRAAAASQSVRDVIQQPTRGLIVDDMGRPLVSNRTSWVVSIDKTTLAGLPPADQATLLDRVATATGEKVKEIKLALAGWNGSRYQPVPIAEDVRQQVALRILEQPEDYPGVVADQQTVRSYPRPYGVNAAGVLGYLSPITADEYDQAKADKDRSLNATSVVGRAGVEKEYDRWLRGMPGHTSVAVDSLGRELGDTAEVPSQPGDTLVTSIDAKVQATAESELHDAIMTARATYDPVTHKNYVADSGAVVVMEARTGRVVAMASEPTYDPAEWVGGITQKQLDALYSKKSGDPLLSRATQGQFAPGSTWKPIMTTGAITGGMGPDTHLTCGPGLQIGNRYFKNYESESYGSISFAEALNVSCDTFFYQVGLHYWNKYGSDPANAHAKDPLAAAAHSFGFGKPTGIDIPGEAGGRVGDRVWRADYYQAMKGYYCTMDKKGTATTPFLKLFAHEFCLQGNYFRQGDAANFTIGQGDTMVTPLQLARAYSALSNGGTLYAPTIGKAIVAADGTVLKRIKPKVVRHVAVSKQAIDYVDTALLGTLTPHGSFNGTLAWKFGGFPLDRIPLRGKTGSAEVEGKQSTSWVATYDKDYVVIMVVTQAGTGSGTSGPAVRAIWESLYGVQGEQTTTQTVDESKAIIPGVTPPSGLPTFAKDGSILPPVREKKGAHR